MSLKDNSHLGKDFIIVFEDRLFFNNRYRALSILFFDKKNRPLKKINSKHFKNI